MMWREFYRRWEPVGLLLASGCCIGSIFPLGKMAGDLGVGPLAYVGATAAGASIVLAVLTLLSGYSLRPDRPTIMYALVAGQLTFAAPWGVIVAVIPHLGSGVTAIVQALTPIFTLAVAYLLMPERPTIRKLGGIALGLVGTVVMIAGQKGTATGGSGVAWYFLGLLGPAILACGNVFRTTHWPAGKPPIVLATWALAAAALGMAVTMAVYAIFAEANSLHYSLYLGWKLIAVQSLATGCGYAFMFRLQLVGGPIFLSQLSYVNAAVGVVFAVLLFSERLAFTTWIALALIVAGIMMTTERRTAESMCDIPAK